MADWRRRAGHVETGVKAGCRRSPSRDDDAFGVLERLIGKAPCAKKKTEYAAYVYVHAAFSFMHVRPPYLGRTSCCICVGWRHGVDLLLLATRGNFCYSWRRAVPPRSADVHLVRLVQCMRGAEIDVGPTCGVASLGLDATSQLLRSHGDHAGSRLGRRSEGTAADLNTWILACDADFHRN
jgi:hypothetical protein